MSSVLPGVYRLTYQDWLAFPDDGRLYEILEGDLFVTPPPSIRHQRISRDLGLHLARHLEDTGAGEMLHAPVGVRLSDDDVVEPDLLVVLTAHADRIGEQAVLGAPDLVVEILSPGTARRDLGTKREKYEAAGVREYWIVDPESRSVEVLSLESDRFVRRGLFRSTDTLESSILAGLRIHLAPIL